MKALRVQYAFIRAAFHNAWIYQLEFWLITPGLFIMMYASYSIWSILYQQSPNAFGMDPGSMTTYGVLGMLLVPLMRTAWITQYYMAQQVREGTLELDLMKPLDFIWHMFNHWQVSAAELINELAQRYPVEDISVEEPEIEAIVREICERSATGERLEG